jgi:hypothetical protein
MSEFLLELNGPGMVLFDAVSVENYRLRNAIASDDILGAFLENSVVGDRAIREGVMLPVYNIPPLHYTVRLQKEKSRLSEDHRKFSYSPFPLAIVSGKLIVADIYALMEWEADYYKGLKPGVREFPTQGAYLIEPGSYAVEVNGFCERRDGAEDKGYEFVLTKMDRLPEIDIQRDIGSYNFDLV